MRAKNINTTALAFLGDAAYEVFVRKRLLMTGVPAADKLHIRAVKYVRAESQAKAIKEIFESLEPEEKSLVKRARNRKSATRPRNVNPITYKWATAFEALLGHMYIEKDFDRMDEIMDQAMKIIDIKDAPPKKKVSTE